MKTRIRSLGFFVALAAALAVGVAVAVAYPPAGGQSPWSLNATIIEACSCEMFCPCYFSTKPSPADGGHSGHSEGGSGHYCRFSMAYKVNKGKGSGVDLAGAKFWIAGDLGDDFGDGQTEWAEVTFDPSVTKEQRDAIAGALPKLDGGKGGEIVLAHNPTAMNAEPTVIKNLKYFAAPRNDGFVLMPSQLIAYRRGTNPFEYKNTNGFMITVDVASTDVPPAAGTK